MMAWPVACARPPAAPPSRIAAGHGKWARAPAADTRAREAARLMGLDDSYHLPPGETRAANKVIGDGVSVPVVRWLGEHLLAPLATGGSARAAA